MKNLYIQKISANHYTFDHGSDSASGAFELSMKKSPMGWIIEATDLTKWETETKFLWVAGTAREAVKDCLQTLRYIERHNKYKVRA